MEISKRVFILKSLAQSVDLGSKADLPVKQVPNIDKFFQLLSPLMLPFSVTVGKKDALLKPVYPIVDPAKKQSWLDAFNDMDQVVKVWEHLRDNYGTMTVLDFLSTGAMLSSALNSCDRPRVDNYMKAAGVKADYDKAIKLVNGTVANLQKQVGGRINPTPSAEVV